MTVKEIKMIAKQMGIKPAKMKKQELIRSIQNKEGNNPCFQNEINSCQQQDCCWRKDCID